MIEAWEPARLDVGLAALARAAGLEPRRVSGQAAAGADALEAHAAAIDLAIDELSCDAGELAGVLRSAAPLIVRVGGGDASRYLLVLRVAGRRAIVLTAAGRSTIALARLCDAVIPPISDALRAECAAAVAGTSLSARRQRRIVAALVAARRPHTRIQGLFRLRLPPDRPFGAHLRGAGAFALALSVVLAWAGQAALWLASWWFLSQWIGAGASRAGWLAGWLLSVVTAMTLRLLAMDLASRVTLAFGAALRERALMGATRLPFAALHGQGVGALLGRVFELSAIEADGLRGALGVAFAGLELALIAILLFALGDSMLHPLLLVAWGGLIAVTVAWYGRAYARWHRRRLARSQAQIENLIGQASCLVQRDPARQLEAADRQTADYLVDSRALDRRALVLVHVLPRAWLCVAVAGLGLMAAAGATTADLLLAAAGSILAARALRPAVEGGARLVHATASWRQLAPLLAVAPERAAAAPPSRREAPHVVRAVGLTQQAGGRAVLDDCSLTLAPGERVLLEGASGAGKSTLGLVLAGLAAPQQGTVLAGGDDLHTAGARRWRTRVAYTPQFSRNHVFQGSLAFNLLVGRAWPPSAHDLADAAQVCDGLGLGPLVARMPAGLHTVVGETGWQLSHGERSRVFLARALLQGAGAVVLDESLAALDPDTARATLAFLEQRPEALVIISHP